MSIGIVLRFEEALALRLRAHAQDLHRACGGIDLAGLKIPAHLTLTLGEDPPPARLAAEVEATFRERPSFAIDLAAVGTFGEASGVVFLAPAVDASLRLLHADALGAFERAGADCHPLYREGAWLPHLTVGHGIEPSHLGAALGRTVPLVPLRARVTSIDLVRTDLEVRRGFAVLAACRMSR